VHTVDPNQHHLSLGAQIMFSGARHLQVASATRRRITMHRTTHLSVRSVTIAGLAASALLGLAGVTFSARPAAAIIYCTYVGYPAGCVARAGVVLRPRPVARAAVRHNIGGNANGGVNRVGVRR
jgi:hypothetical protein